MSIETRNFSGQSIQDRYGNTSPLVWLTLILTVTVLALFGIGLVDNQQFNGVNAWDKPAKFALSLALHGATLVWGMQHASQATRHSKSVRFAALLFVLATTFEMFWITFQASRGQGSHFNTEGLLPGIMYGIMGIGSLCLTGITIFMGWKILRSGSSVMQLATGYGFILSGVLTTIVAGYMSSGTGHWVGGDLSDATGLGFFHWSTTGGDLRVPHFAALHIAQALPFLAWLMPDRRIVMLGSLGSSIVVVALFAQALMGIPFLAN
jgi:hypothetical protein